MMLFYLMLGLAPHGLDLGFGLGPHLLKRLIRRTLNDLALYQNRMSKCCKQRKRVWQIIGEKNGKQEEYTLHG